MGCGRSKPNTHARPDYVASLFQSQELLDCSDWSAIHQKLTQAMESFFQNSAAVHMALGKWQERQGDELESVLGSGAIALLNAQWLVNFVESHSSNNHAQDETPVLPCRQDLPPEAFLTLDQIRQSSHGNREELHILLLSYMWLSPGHPDPKGETLKLVANHCRGLLEGKLRDMRPIAGLPRECPLYGIFWDFGSLYQHPDPANQVYRTDAQEKLFQQGLNALPTLYSHPYTICIKVTQFPEGYPNGYNLPPGANCAEYHQRGWPIVESSLVGMVKQENLVLDISTTSSTTTMASRTWSNKKDNAPIKRPAPLTPEKMATKVQNLSFTNAKDDRPLVARLYKSAFLRRFTTMDTMSFSYMNWDDEQICNVAEIIQQGYTPKLHTIKIGLNKFGPGGCQALAHALLPSMAPNVHLTIPLLELQLSKNIQIGNVGIQVLARALMRVHTVWIKEVGLGVEGCRSLANATKETTPDNFLLQNLYMDQNKDVGDEGLKLLAEMVVQRLHDFDVKGCNIGEEGCKALADTAEASSFSQLERITLVWNPAISEEVCQQHLSRFVKQCQSLHQIGLDDSSQREGMLKAHRRRLEVTSY